MATHITLQQIDQDYKVFTKKYTADDPFRLPFYEEDITHLELVYDMENLFCELYLNSDRDNGLGYHHSVMIDDEDYPTAALDRKLLKDMTNQIYNITKEIEDVAPNENQLLEYEY